MFLPRPIPRDELNMLRRIAKGRFWYDRDKPEVAWLIEEGCVEADPARKTLTLTEQGRGALLHYGSDDHE
jgi:hypothetical protein